MKITGIDPKDLAAIVAGLVKEGVMFESYPDPNVLGAYQIKLSGGF